MTDAPWWTSAVVYQIYPRSFADSDGDGIGDLRGIISKLGHLADLGIDVIWLSPIYPSPQDDNGYDISDYQDIDPTFGDLATFDELLTQVHARGMKLIMDLVVNHTSDEHPWFVESSSSRDNPKRDWYYWHDAREGFEPGAAGAEPTDWTSFFSGSVWKLDERTGQYFLHLFSRKQPDLNWENPEVRNAVYAMMNWWLDRGVDGFRMDVINMISKVLPFKDGIPVPGVIHGNGAAEYLNGPRVHEFLAEMHREVFAHRDAALLTVGETPGATVRDAVLYTDPERRELDMIFQFEHVDLDHGSGKFDHRPLKLTDLKATMNRWQVGLAQTGWNSLYWNNHDQPRIVSRYGSDDPAHRVTAAKMLGTVLHLHRGTPYVYQGEELGMTNTVFGGLEDFRDIESLNYFAGRSEAGDDPEQILDALRPVSRDNARTPVQWDDSAHAGFTTGEPWLAANPNHREINAAAQASDPDSVLHHYRALIALRHAEPAVVLGDFTMLLPDDERVYAFTRRLHGTELLVLGNFSDDPADPPVPDGWADAEVVSGTGSGTALGPWEGRALRRVLS